MAEMTPEERRELDALMGKLLLPGFTHREIEIAANTARAAIEIAREQYAALRAERDAHDEMFRRGVVDAQSDDGHERPNRPDRDGDVWWQRGYGWMSANLRHSALRAERDALARDYAALAAPPSAPPADLVALVGEIQHEHELMAGGPASARMLALWGKLLDYPLPTGPQPMGWPDANNPVRWNQKPDCVIGVYCQRHGFIHGQEAEELREHLEVLNLPAVNRVLDEVDERDSLAYLEATNEPTPPDAAPRAPEAAALLVHPLPADTTDVCQNGHATFVGSCVSCVLLHKRTLADTPTEDQR